MMEEPVEAGTYVYCIVRCNECEDLGYIGIDDELVHTIAYRDLCTVTHRCQPKPYITDDRQKVKEWVLSHQYVLDVATARYGTVIPLAFDTIFKGDDATVKGWIKTEYQNLKGLLEWLKGKSEYGIQVFIDSSYADTLSEDSQEVRAIRSDLAEKPDGVAYLLKKKLERIVRAQREIRVHEISKGLHDRIADFVDEIKIERTRGNLEGELENKIMILNASCLVNDSEIISLGKLLSEVNDGDRLTVRFTGPWPPYSFVTGVREKQ